MFRKLAEKLFVEAPEAGHGPDRVQLATCVIMLEAARADEEFTVDERRHILQVLRERFELDREEADELLECAEAAREESSDLFSFTHQLNESLTIDEKLQIIEEVWRIFYSDGTLSGHEDGLAHQLRKLLRLNHPQFIQAKMRVLDEIRGS